jgi:hypothetical protein
MKEFLGSIWVHYMVADHFVCITTNGTIKKDGAAVMGRGNAKQAKIVIPGIDKILGQYLRENGNVAGVLRTDEFENCLIVFPVKHKWWEEADRKLIYESAKFLWAEATNNPGNTYHLPRPGCGNGKLDWEHDVKTLVSHLPDNVWVHHLP